MATKSQIANAVDSRLIAAVDAGKAARKRGDGAIAVAYEPRSRRLRIELASGVAVSVPVHKVQGLAAATPAVIKSVKLTGKGYSLYWAGLDLDVSVAELVAGCFGTRAWMSALARQGGRATSSAKSVAARKNGLKGGRPRKLAATDVPASALT
jgi:hypothetical protein